MYSKLLFVPRFFLVIVLCFFLVSWGNKGHYAINNKCPQSFPASMNKFLVWADSLAINGSVADFRKDNDPTESPKHYIDIDNYNEFLSAGRIATTYDSIVRIHTSSFVLSNGTLPWATRNMFDTLKLDFQQRKWHKAMLDASDLGHYVGDGHMPLHITKNYDGQLTSQSGIHSRYESTMVSTYLSSLTAYTGAPAQYVSNVNKYIFDYIYKNYLYKDSVLAADTYARNLAGNTTSSTYYSALWSKTRFTTSLFKNASRSLADLIYTAWTDAGSPVFGVINGVQEAGTSPEVFIFPNPTSGHIQIMGEDIVRTEITDLTGRVSGVFYGNSFDVKNFPDGIYFLNMEGNNGMQKREKVIIRK